MEDAGTINGVHGRSYGTRTDGAHSVSGRSNFRNRRAAQDDAFMFDTSMHDAPGLNGDGSFALAANPSQRDPRRRGWR